MVASAAASVDKVYQYNLQGQFEIEDNSMVTILAVRNQLEDDFH